MSVNPIVTVAVIAVWLYILSVLTRAKLYAWKFMWGSFGLFLIMMITIRPMLTMPLARCVSALAGVVGSVTGAFTSYFKYGIIFIHTGVTQATLLIDFECSGIIEIMAFISLLAFFNVYNFSEKVMVGIGGFCYIMLCNALRIVMICMSVYFLGNGSILCGSYIYWKNILLRSKCISVFLCIYQTSGYKDESRQLLIW